MPRTRSILIHGLGITLRRLPAFLWTYSFNLVLALVFCLPLKTQLSDILDHSLAAQRLSSGFDLGTVAAAAMRIHGGSGGGTGVMTSQGSVPLYFLLYFLLVPGTLYCYLTRNRARLSTLLHQGLLYFWRFIRITLLTLLAGVLLPGPIVLLHLRWARFVDDKFVGRPALLLTLAGLFLVMLAASLLRLYFDLVETYTVQLGTQFKRNGKPDRRVRRTLVPAFRLLRDHLARAWLTFLLLAALGSIAGFFFARTAMFMLAQQRVWPMFLVAQFGLFLMLFTRFWQRGAEAALILEHPLPPEAPVSRPHDTHPSTPPPTTPTATPPSLEQPELPPEHLKHIEMIYSPDPLTAIYPAPLSPDDPLAPLTPPEESTPRLPDPIPNPEPAPPSLDEPDPGVFHHDPQKPDSNQ